MGRMQYAPTLPAGDVSYLYPQRLPRTRHFLLLDLPFSMSPCRGVLHTPHKTARKGRSYLSMGRCFYPCRIHVGRILLRPTLPAGDISIVIAIKFFLESILFLS